MPLAPPADDARLTRGIQSPTSEAAAPTGSSGVLGSLPQGQVTATGCGTSPCSSGWGFLHHGCGLSTGAAEVCSVFWVFLICFPLAAVIEPLFFTVIKDQALAGALSGAVCCADCSLGIAPKNQAGTHISHLSRRCSPQPPAGKPFPELLGWAAQRKHGTLFFLFLKDGQKNTKGMSVKQLLSPACVPSSWQKAGTSPDKSRNFKTVEVSIQKSRLACVCFCSRYRIKSDPNPAFPGGRSVSVGALQSLC